MNAVQTLVSKAISQLQPRVNSQTIAHIERITYSTTIFLNYTQFPRFMYERAVRLTNRGRTLRLANARAVNKWSSTELSASSSTLPSALPYSSNVTQCSCVHCFYAIHHVDKSTDKFASSRRASRLQRHNGTRVEQ